MMSVWWIIDSRKPFVWSIDGLHKLCCNAIFEPCRLVPSLQPPHQRTSREAVL